MKVKSETKYVSCLLQDIYAYSACVVECGERCPVVLVQWEASIQVMRSLWSNQRPVWWSVSLSGKYLTIIYASIKLVFCHTEFYLCDPKDVIMNDNIKSWKIRLPFVTRSESGYIVQLQYQILRANCHSLHPLFSGTISKYTRYTYLVLYWHHLHIPYMLHCFTTNCLIVLSFGNKHAKSAYKSVVTWLDHQAVVILCHLSKFWWNNEPSMHQQ